MHKPARADKPEPRHTIVCAGSLGKRGVTGALTPRAI